MVYDRKVDVEGRVADKKARRSIARMESSSARCQQTLDIFKKWDNKFKNICDTKRRIVEADDAIRQKKPQLNSPFAMTRVARSRVTRKPALPAIAEMEQAWKRDCSCRHEQRVFRPRQHIRSNVSAWRK